MDKEDFEEAQKDINLDNLYPALVECFGVILLGYLARKFSLINDVQSEGISIFIGNFSLPALIFTTLCQLNFSSVNWFFLNIFSSGFT